MNCQECGGTMVARAATPEGPYTYGLSGLRDIQLAGVTVYRCLGCTTETPVIPKIVELHRVIAEGLLRKAGSLAGDELRFLRKNAGLPAKKFAALLGVDPAHLSRVENGHVKALGDPADRLARAVVAAAMDGEDVRGVLLRMADDLEGRRKAARGRRPIFQLVKNRWRPAA